MLRDDAHTCQELADETGLRILTVRLFINELHKQKVIHIARWERVGVSNNVRAFKLGKNKDAPKPPRRSNAENCRLYNARRKALRQQMQIANALAGKAAPHAAQAA